MKVLIIKANQDIIKDILPKVVFIESTANTCIFNVTTKTFIKLRDEVRKLGINPYSLMHW